MSRIVWSPSEDYVERANVTRFMRAHGIGSYDELVKRSQGDIEWFWAAVVDEAVRNAVAMAYRFAASRFIERVEQDIAAAAVSQS